MKNLEELYTAIKTEANRLGFNHMGVAPALPVPHYQDFVSWVEAGWHGDMGYLARPDTLGDLDEEFRRTLHSYKNRGKPPRF